MLLLALLLPLAAAYLGPAPAALGPGPGGAPAGAGAPACVDIPANLTLCRGIGYARMRLPNLLDHDSMAEVAQQAASWVPLPNLKCHPDTQLFLCSLFAPVCLDRPIPPCRSLCEAVRAGCGGRMRAYGFPWPEMVRCDKFPPDNDMCISVMAGGADPEPQSCSACNQPDTYENIIDNFCRADFVVRTKIRRLQRGRLSCKRARILKIREGVMSRREVRRPTLRHANLSACCGELAGRAGKEARLLVMGVRDAAGDLSPTLIMEWRQGGAFRDALRAMKRIDCSNPQIIPEAGEEVAGAADEGERQRRSKKRPPTAAKKKKKKNKRKGGAAGAAPSGTLAVVSGGPAPTFRT